MSTEKIWAATSLQICGNFRSSFRDYKFDEIGSTKLLMKKTKTQGIFARESTQEEPNKTQNSLSKFLTQSP
jgi:hypothetical protein